jgi:hypothetical protein
MSKFMHNDYGMFGKINLKIYSDSSFHLHCTLQGNN